jgi:uncharacterized LabA/DUF88 family protein
MSNKIYKEEFTQKYSMHPGDRNGSPDDCFIFVDDGFLSKLSKYFGGGAYLKFNRVSFCQKLAVKENLYCKKIFYYIAPPYQSNNPNKEERKRKDNYDKFKKKLINLGIIFREGRCQKIKNNNNVRYSQKAVDSLMIIDLMAVPIKNPNIKNIIIIASDSDFVPAIEQLKELEIEVILYTYFVKKRDTGLSRSNFLIKSVSKYSKLTKQDFEDCPI